VPAAATALRRRQRLVALVTSLPEATATGEQHLRLDVRGKSFGYYLDDHHGDGRIALACKAAPGVAAALVRQEPERYFIPSYVGPKGWVGLYLDLPRIDWAEVEELVVDAYRLQAPKNLVVLLD
jgi:hypothetical protein